MNPIEDIFSDPASEDEPDKSIVVSPDGRYVFFMAFHGDLRDDAVVNDLYVYSVRDILRMLQTSQMHPTAAGLSYRHIVFRTSRPNGGFFGYVGAIVSPHWQDAHDIIFSASQGRLPHRVYRLDVVSGKLAALTDEVHDVVELPIVNGDSVIFFERVQGGTPKHPLDTYPMKPILDDDLFFQSLTHAFPYIREYTIRMHEKVSHFVRDIPLGKFNFHDLETRVIRQSGHLPVGLSLRVKETVNDPPSLVASRGSKEVALVDADPALAGLWRAPVQTVHWSEPDGAPESGLLMLPHEFMPGSPVPLVIQDGDPRISRTRFRPDGPNFTSWAAQPLVGQGFAVLQIDQPYLKHPETLGTAREAQLYVSGIDAAVDALAAQKIVDPKRVGLIGWSRSGFMNFYAITHPGHTKIAAAIADDSTTGNYSQYVILKALHPSNAIPSIFWAGGTQQHPVTFWDDKQTWLKCAPGFNVDRSATPMLFTFNSSAQSEMIFEFETVAAFRATHRPFEMLVFPQSSHETYRPKEREALMQVSVDWMNFWLQNKLPSDPDRAARWKQMKADWDQTQK